MSRLALITILAASTLAACEDPGPFEQAGEEIDEAVEDAQVEGETTGNRLDDAVDEAREGIEDAADEVDEEL